MCLHSSVLVDRRRFLRRQNECMSLMIDLLCAGICESESLQTGAKEGWRTLVVRSCSAGRVSLRARRPCWTRSFRLPVRIEDTGIGIVAILVWSMKLLNEIGWELPSSHVLTHINKNWIILVKNGFFSTRVNTASKKEFHLTVCKLVHESLQVGACRLRARSDGHGFAVKVVGRRAGLEDMRSHVLGNTPTNKQKLRSDFKLRMRTTFILVRVTKNKHYS